jgi:ABC-type uncharacterized transport system auxiliary subunit
MVVKRRQGPIRATGSLLGAALLLAGCGPIISFGDDGPVDAIYSLRYEGGFPTDKVDGPIVYVEEPHFADDLDGRSVSVLLAGNRRSTIDGVAWSSPLSELVRNYITRSLADGLGANIVSEGALDVNSTCRIGSKVWALELVPGRDAAADRVEITIELSLVRFRDSTLIGHPTISRTAKVAGSDDAAVMAAFGKAMAGVSDEMRSWFKGALSGCAAPRPGAS